MMPANHARGQALIEFAILGSLALTALAFMIQIGLRMNYQQEIEQQTFRRALFKAHEEGNIESQANQVQQFRDRQIPDPSQDFAIMPRTTTQASATATWGERLTFLDQQRDSQPRIMVHLNNAETELRSEDLVEGQPLVRRIDKSLNSNGTVTQNNDGSRLSTSTTEDTTMQLNTQDNRQVSSSVSANVNLDWQRR